jgi:uncharacterized protein
MNCPSCAHVQLLMSERQGVEIDYCPQCRGVWLDRGELDKIIERSAAESGYGAQDGYAGKRHDGHDGHHDKHHGKKSLLRELFD